MEVRRLRRRLRAEGRRLRRRLRAVVRKRRNGGMRDHTKLKVFHAADELVLLIYRETQSFPKEELFGLTAQLRRSALSIACNIVEGSARNTEADYLHFMCIAYGSAREVQYQISVAERLGFLRQAEKVKELSRQISKQLNALIRSLQKQKQSAAPGSLDNESQNSK